MPQIHRDFRSEDLEALLCSPASNGEYPDASSAVEGVVLVQAANSIRETQFLLDESMRLSVPSAVVGWINLASDVPEQLARIAEHRCARRFTGIRHLSHVDPDPGWLLNPAVAAGVRSAAASGLAIDLVVRSHQLGQAVALIRGLPDTQFVLDHLGNPPLGGGELDGWSRGISEVAQLPNVVVKLSGLMVEAESSEAGAGALGRALDLALERFGSGRLLFGSDWPLVLLGRDGYAGWVQRFLAAVSGLSAAEQKAICATNARQIYGIQNDFIG